MCIRDRGKVGLVSIEDINRDGILQLAELSLNPDVIVLATPEIAGLPYVISGLVGAGAMAAALSTADGLLLTIASALSHDVYYKVFRPNATTQWRLVVSKSLLLVVAVLAAMAVSYTHLDVYKRQACMDAMSRIRRRSTTALRAGTPGVPARVVMAKSTI